jgi:hypothetical protein
VPVVLVDPPGDLALTYDGAQITATWTGRPGDTGYVVELTGGGVDREQTVPGASVSARIPADGLPRNASYAVTVAAESGGITSRPAAAATITLVDPPAGLHAGYAGGELTVSWTAVPGVTGYLVDVSDPAGGSVRTQFVPDAVTARLPADGLTRGVQYTVTVASEFGSATSRPSAPVPVTMADPPDGLRVSYAGGGLNATWTPVTGATGYRIVLLDPAGAIAADQTVSSAGATLPATGLSGYVTYTASVATIIGQTVSALSVPVPVVLVDPPGGLALAFDGTSVIATWTAIPVTSYRVTLRDQHGTEVGSQTVAAPAATAAFPAGGLTRRVQYSASVSAQVGSFGSVQSANAYITLLDAPTGLALSYDGTGITATWNAVAGASMYLVKMYDPAGVNVATMFAMGEPRVVFAAAGLAREVAYTADITVQVATLASPPSPRAAIILVDPPAGLAASYTGTDIAVSWTGVGGGNSYLVYLRDPGGTQIAPATAVTGTVSTHLPAAGLARAVPYTVTAATVYGTITSRQSAPVPVVLVDPPAGLSLNYSGTQLMVTWVPVTGATGYSATLTSGATTLQAQDVTTAQVVFPAAGLPRGVPVTVSVTTIAGPNRSPVATQIPIVLVDPPTGITATYTGGQITASWAPAAGAAAYKVQVVDPAGQVITTANPVPPLYAYGGAEIVPGAPYSIRVASVATVTSPYSALVPVVQDTFTCMCLGTTPGAPCGNGAPSGPFTALAQNVTRQVRDAVYTPARAASRTGWVAVPPGQVGHVAVLCQLLIKLTTGSFLSATEAFGVLAGPRQVAAGTAGGNLNCMCLGMTPGGGCGNGSTSGYNADVWTHLTQAQVDAFAPTRNASRTGWVVVGSDPYDPLEVMLQLVMTLGKPGKLGGSTSMSWDIFNASTNVKVTADPGGGSTTCLALGTPVGYPCKTMGGQAGDVAVNLTPATLAAYQPGQASGWAAIQQDPLSVLAALLHLVTTLWGKGILSGTQPFDIFNNARPAIIS